MKKEEIIEGLYIVFGRYTTSNMHHCDCGCIDSEDVRRLASKKLRELTENDLSPYHGSALYTWGDLEHYKHFLPRILEVYNGNRKGLIDLYEISGKLNFAEWRHWPEAEVRAIKNFVMMDWEEYVSISEFEVGKEELEHYSQFFPINELIKSWKIPSRGKRLEKFVEFFYQYGNHLINRDIEIRNQSLYKEIFCLINSGNVIELLETEFFERSEKEPVYSSKVSVVIQLIEQGKNGR